MNRSKKKTVLILCTGNSCRSQMAEAILRDCGGDYFEVYSAGGDPAGYVHPLAIEVMRDAGMDLGGARSKNFSEFSNQEVNTVITVCGKVDQICPVFPGQINRYHWGFDDPADFQGDEELVKAQFVRVRDEIRLVCEAYVCGIREGIQEVDEVTSILVPEDISG